MKLYIVGIGPGNYGGMTVEACKVLERCRLVVGYTTYTDILKEYFPQKKYYSTPMTKEKDRVKYALEKTSEGIETALICSGDSGVYGMAGLALEMSAQYPDAEIEIIPGVTAALSGGAVLGAPVSHDFAVVSLSDLLTPWEKIKKRLECAAAADFVICMYNPSSKKRSDYLQKACDIILKFKSGDTICGYVKNIGRNGQESGILTLLQLREFHADMFTTVFVGNSETKAVNNKMVTLRGYKNV